MIADERSDRRPPQLEFQVGRFAQERTNRRFEGIVIDGEMDIVVFDHAPDRPRGKTDADLAREVSSIGVAPVGNLLL